MMTFPKNNEMKTFNDKSKTARARTDQIMRTKGRKFRSIVDENRGSKEIEVYVCAADVVTTDHRLVWTVNRREL